MIHNEHLRKADELYEVRHDNCGNAIHVHIKDGHAKIFGSLDDFIRYVYEDDVHIEFLEVDENMLESIYETQAYTLHQVKNYIISKQASDEFIYPIYWEHDYRRFYTTIDIRFESISLVFSAYDFTYAFDILINSEAMMVSVISKQNNYQTDIKLNGNKV